MIKFIAALLMLSVSTTVLAANRKCDHCGYAVPKQSKMWKTDEADKVCGPCIEVEAGGLWPSIYCLKCDVETEETSILKLRNRGWKHISEARYQVHNINCDFKGICPRRAHSIEKLLKIEVKVGPWIWVFPGYKFDAT